MISGHDGAYIKSIGRSNDKVYYPSVVNDDGVLRDVKVIPGDAGERQRVFLAAVHIIKFNLIKI